jgi:hypothetical protein
MTQKRLKRLVVGGALTALVLGGSASAEAATDSGASSTTASPQPSNGGGLPARGSPRAPGAAAHENADPTVAGSAADEASSGLLTIGRGGSVGARHQVRDRLIRDQYLTDHEQYVRHHQRLASQA